MRKRLKMEREKKEGRERKKKEIKLKRVVGNNHSSSLRIFGKQK